MEIGEEIKHCEKIAEDQEWMAEAYGDDSMGAKLCKECAEEHRQLAEWLKELKFYKDRQDLINKSWQELIRYKEGIEKIKMRSQSYRESGETILASGMEQALDILKEVSTYDRDID